MTTPVRTDSGIVETGGGPAVVSAPSTQGVALAVQDALSNQSPIRIIAGGGWLDAGNPVHANTQLNIQGLNGILEYSPGDFTLTARAATPLSAIAAATAEHGQWLTLDPFGSPHGTLGATLATASSGPLAMSFGLPRDNVLGIEVVTGDARIIRAGGKVVKNVAGFDLVRLNIGAWGTLGVLTEATVRLRALPEVDRTMLIPLPSADPDTEWWKGLRTLPSVVVACEAFTGTLATRLGLSPIPAVAVRMCGNSSDVSAVESMLRDLGTPGEAPPSLWTDLRACEPREARVMRYSALPSHFDKLWAHVATPGNGPMAHASVARGVVRCFSDAATTIPPIPSMLAFDVGLRVERGHTTPTVSAPSATGDLMRRVHDAFDPQRMLNPGIMEAV